MAQPRPHVIGIDIADLRTDVKSALRQAAALDFRTIEIPTAHGELAPQNLSPSARRDVSRYIGGLGLSPAALSADMPTLRLTDPGTVEERIDRTRHVLDLARDLRVNVVSTGVGALTDLQTGQPSDLAISALSRLGEYADIRGVLLALRPSYDTGARWLAVLDALRCPAIRVCWDPAGMVMTGANPMLSIERFIEQVALFHARDATAGFVDRGRGEPGLGHETPLGEGDVDLVGILEALASADYNGPYILRRTESTNPSQDLIAARDTLKRYRSAQ